MFQKASTDCSAGKCQTRDEKACRAYESTSVIVEKINIVEKAPDNKARRRFDQLLEQVKKHP